MAAVGAADVDVAMGVAPVIGPELIGDDSSMHASTDDESSDDGVPGALPKMAELRSGQCPMPRPSSWCRPSGGRLSPLTSRSISTPGANGEAATSIIWCMVPRRAQMAR